MRFREKAAAESGEGRGAKRLARWKSTIAPAILLAGLIAGCCAGSSNAEQAARQSPTFSQPSAANQFKHNSPDHSKMKCDQCHVRRADAIKPVVPGHRACISCHIKEFTATGFGICANCHDGIKAVRPKVLPFPERQSFGVSFSHTTHATNQNGERRAVCTDCHNVAGAGTSFPAHKECYVCHKSPDQVKAGEKVGGSSCGECHITTINAMPHVAMARAYNFRFTHSVHVQREGISCSECHRVLGEGPTQMALPQLKEHRGAGFQSCGMCHNGRRAFGGELANNACIRCHGRNMM